MKSPKRRPPARLRRHFLEIEFSNINAQEDSLFPLRFQPIPWTLPKRLRSRQKLIAAILSMDTSVSERIAS